MNLQLKRVLGSVLVIIAALSLAVSVSGVIGVWLVREPLARQIGATAQLLDDTLATTGEALTVANEGLATATSNLNAIVAAMQALAKTVTDTEPALDKAVALLKVELPASIGAIRTALDPAEQTVKVVDNVLRTLSGVPLINVDYNPAVPLDQAVRRIADSLTPLPAALVAIGTDLETAQGNVSDIALSVDQIASEVQRLGPTLTQAQTVLQEYQQQLNNFQSLGDSIVTGIAPLMNGVAAVVSFILFWLGAVQVLVIGIGARWARTTA